MIIKLDGPAKELLLFHLINDEQILNEKVIYPTRKSHKVWQDNFLHVFVVYIFTDAHHLGLNADTRFNVHVY